MKHNIWLYFPFGLMLSSLKMDNALRRTLMASVLMLTMSMLTAMVILVVPRILSGCPVKVMLKMNTSEKIHVHHTFAKGWAIAYLRVALLRPSSCRTRRSSFFFSISGFSIVQLQDLEEPQREQICRRAVARKRPKWSRSKCRGRLSSLGDIMSLTY